MGPSPRRCDQGSIPGSAPFLLSSKKRVPHSLSAKTGVLLDVLGSAAPLRSPQGPSKGTTPADEKEKSPAMTTAMKEKPSDDLNSCLGKTLRLLLISLLQCIGFGTRRDLSSEWKSQLIGKVNQHSLDNSSLEMKIAWMTALIRHWSMIVDDIAKKTPKVSFSACSEIVTFLVVDVSCCHRCYCC
ncbi:hypothetical protein Q1695_009487 [Nippostrongylus brasiliensis]|nr:hypothetical protein Q1695_009487 [Nippostrongylus brasiliensis]